MPHRNRAVAGLGLAALLLISGCGGSGSAAASGGTAAPAGSVSVNTDELVEFARCLRANGVDVPDPRPGQNLMTWLSQEQRGKLKNSGAVEACRDKLPSAVKERLNDPEWESKALRFAQCMRDNGVDMPDPRNGRLDFGDVDRDSPASKEAFGECRPRLTGQGGR
jgi:hypothetical protein